MRLFDPDKWERVRAKGRRRFIRHVTLKYFFVAGILIVSLNLWSIRQLQVDLPWAFPSLRLYIWLAALFAFIVFPLGGALCAWGIWQLNEHFYKNRIASSL